MSDSKLEGFARESNLWIKWAFIEPISLAESSQFEFESRNSPRLPSFREHRSRGETRESPLKNQTPLIEEESQGKQFSFIL